MSQGRIDPHVHCRDGIESYKSTIPRVFQLADAQGVEIIFDMPNTNPPICRRRDVKERLRLVPPSCRERYGLYVGLTSDPVQIREAVQCYDEFSEVVGLKLFAGKSIGDLSVTSEKDQRTVYQVLAGVGFEGVLAVHCEKESLLLPDRWNPLVPYTHTQARPSIAEIESVEDQTRFVAETGFSGTLHICHISTPEAVELVCEARAVMNITCGVTPHHILYNAGMYNQKSGLVYKMNPPLRSEAEQIALLQCLSANMIDWIETDHAPHALDEKLFPPYLSGFPSLALYRGFVDEYLPNAGFAPYLIDELTRTNIQHTFGTRAGT